MHRRGSSGIRIGGGGGGGALRRHGLRVRAGLRVGREHIAVGLEVARAVRENGGRGRVDRERRWCACDMDGGAVCERDGLPEPASTVFADVPPADIIRCCC